MVGRYLRRFRSSRGSLALAFLTLTLAIASATTTFSVVDAIVLRRLPFPDDSRVLAISRLSSSNPVPGPVAPQDFFAWQAETSAFESLAASANSAPVRLGAPGQEETVLALRATSGFFDVLRIRPVLGRAFAPEHERTGSDAVVLISHRLWLRRLNGDPAAVGTTMLFGKQARQIIGVLPPGFTYPVGRDTFTDVWIPLVPRDQERDPASGGRSYYLQVIGRLRAGVTVELARADVERVRDSLEAAYPASGWRDQRVRVIPLRDHIIGPAKGWMLLVLGAVALVLVIACANVANLLLVRATARQRDLAIRTSLGASSGQLFRGMLLESAGLAAVSAAAGVLMAAWGVDLVRAYLPEGLARVSDIALDTRVLIAAAAATAVTALFCGVVPAWQASGTDIVTLIKGDAALAGVTTGGRLRSAFLILQVGFVVVLLVGTTFLVASFRRVSQVDLGFEPRRLISMPVESRIDSVERERSPQLALSFYREVVERVSRVPGVLGAGVYDGGRPLAGGGVRYSIKGFGAEGGDDMVDLRAISPSYIQAAGMRVLEGRPLLDSDSEGSTRVALVNDVVAARYFQGRSPIGQTITFRAPIEIVGVVRAVRTAGPEVDPRPEMYFPIAQHPQPTGFTSPMIVAIRLAGTDGSVVPVIQAALRDVLPAGARPPEAFSFEEALGRLTAQRRFSAGLMMLFGVLALIIGTAGIYAVMASVVTQRTREIGIRIAIGASAGRVLRTVLAKAVRHLAAGLALGLLASWTLSGLFASLVFDVQPTDVRVYAVAAAMVLAVGLAAAAVPAIRAARVDPLIALRTD